jgi:hypothetical protein
MQKIQTIRLGNLWRDLVIILLSIAITVLLVEMGALAEFFSLTQGRAILGSFVAGIFFTSVFTLAPAAITLASIANFAPALTVALWGGLGAMFGDLLLFLFIRDVFVDDLEGVAIARKIKRYLLRPHAGFLRWILPVLGALIIASPLPDEIGLALLGFSKMKTMYVLPVAFVMNFLGIFAIAYAAQHLG